MINEKIGKNESVYVLVLRINPLKYRAAEGMSLQHFINFCKKNDEVLFPTNLNISEKTVEELLAKGRVLVFFLENEKVHWFAELTDFRKGEDIGVDFINALTPSSYCNEKRNYLELTNFDYSEKGIAFDDYAMLFTQFKNSKKVYPSAVAQNRHFPSKFYLVKK
ncbi:hypothetical protein [Robertmurraya massiliosenegalensis]|uniref:hypothetical protein n=1 Tax=Robertmurraya massiliosenegalensis TaxID=1287657 RepID=UPI0002DA8A83|nr:hypothetical protein [Robertmurraya massiliosenegalensis]